MYSMAKLCSKCASTLNLAVRILFHHETSVHSRGFIVSILRPIRPGRMNCNAYNIVGGKCRGHVLNSLKEYVLGVILH